MALGAQLQFKMGRFKNGEELVLNKVAKKAGTVYVTTDEKAMYVDVDDSTRIRIGDIIQLNSVREARPPFSEDALYYFIEENALLKWTELFKKNEDGTRGESLGMGWQQLNSISDVTANLNAVEGRVTAAETAIAGLKTTVNGSADTEGLVAKVATLEGSAETEGSVLHAEASAAAALTQANKGVKDAATAQAKANENAGLISGIDGRLEEVEDSVAILGGEANVSGSVKEAKAAADAAKAQADKGVADADKAAKAAAAAQKTADSAAASASTNAADILTLGNRVSANEGAITTINTNAEALTTRVTTAEGKITTLEGKMDVLKGGSEVDGSVANAKKAGTDAAAVAAQNKTDIATLTGTVNGLSDSIGTINGELDALEPRVKANEDNIKALQDNLGASDDTKAENTAFGRIAALEESLGGSSEAGSVIERLDEAEATIKTQKEAIEGLTTSVGENTEAISNINGTLGDKLEGQTGTVFELIADNSSDITDNANNIKALQKTVNGDETTVGLVQQVNTNKTDIATLKETVAAIPDDYVSQDTYTADKTQLAKDMEAQHKIITDSIKAANGMTYKKAVTAYNELPTASTEEDPVRVGDTYVVANEDGFINEGTVYYSGDLLIAKGDEVDGVITGKITWDHVKTGYVYKHEATMDAVAGTDNDVAVKLTSFQASIDSDGAGDLGQFTIKGGENVKVSIDADTKVITIGMAWDTF